MAGLQEDLPVTEMERFVRQAVIWGKTRCLFWDMLGLRCRLGIKVDMCRL